MKINSQELTERLAEADRARVALRRATLELAAVGEQLIEQRAKKQNEPIDRAERSHRSTARRP